MKTFALAAAAAVAFSGVVSAQECDIKVITPMFIDLIEDANACAEATQYSFIPPSVSPTAAQGAAICTMCSNLVTKAKTKTFPTCTFVIDGQPTPLDAFFTKVVDACSTTTAPATTSNATVTTPANSTVTTVAPTTTVPTSAPTTTPTPTPTQSAASMLVSVSAAAIVAVATVASFAM